VIEKSKIKEGTKKGETVEKNIGYFTYPQNALNFLLERSIKANDTFNNIQSLFDDLKQAQDDNDKILDQLKDIIISGRLNDKEDKTEEDDKEEE
jgi:hypothetical protein